MALSDDKFCEKAAFVKKRVNKQSLKMPLRCLSETARQNARKICGRRAWKLICVNVGNSATNKWASALKFDKICIKQAHKTKI